MMLVPNFKQIAQELAVNEACAYHKDWAQLECSLDHLCPECQNLAKMFEKELNGAFIAGQKSVVPPPPIEGEIVEALELEDEA